MLFVWFGYQVGWEAMSVLGIFWAICGIFVAAVLRAIAGKMKPELSQNGEKIIIIESSRRGKGELFRLMILWPVSCCGVFSHKKGKLKVRFFPPVLKLNGMIYFISLTFFWPERILWSLLLIPVGIVWFVARGIVNPFVQIPVAQPPSGGNSTSSTGQASTQTTTRVRNHRNRGSGTARTTAAQNRFRQNQGQGQNP